MGAGKQAVRGLHRNRSKRYAAGKQAVRGLHRNRSKRYMLQVNRL